MYCYFLDAPELKISGIGQNAIWILPCFLLHELGPQEPILYVVAENKYFVNNFLIMLLWLLHNIFLDNIFSTSNDNSKMEAYIYFARYAAAQEIFNLYGFFSSWNHVHIY